MNIILKFALLTMVITQGALIIQATDTSTVPSILSCKDCKN